MRKSDIYIYSGAVRVNSRLHCRPARTIRHDGTLSPAVQNILNNEETVKALADFLASPAGHTRAEIIRFLDPLANIYNECMLQSLERAGFLLYYEPKTCRYYLFRNVRRVH